MFNYVHRGSQTYRDQKKTIAAEKDRDRIATGSRQDGDRISTGSRQDRDMLSREIIRNL